MVTPAAIWTGAKEGATEESIEEAIRTSDETIVEKISREEGERPVKSTG
jgi:hypothetical protein